MLKCAQTQQLLFVSLHRNEYDGVSETSPRTLCITKAVI